MTVMEAVAVGTVVHVRMPGEPCVNATVIETPQGLRDAWDDAGSLYHEMDGWTTMIVEEYQASNTFPHACAHGKRTKWHRVEEHERLEVKP